jgi:phytoene dehydrogenase-like protein
VLVLEAQPSIGGAVKSDESVEPGFVHDTFSAFYPLAAVSPTINSFRLEEHGLRWSHAPGVVGHPTPDGEWAILHRDRFVTAALMEAQEAGDGDAWLTLCEQWDHIGNDIVNALISPFPPIKHGLAAVSKLRRVGGLDFVRDMLTPAAELASVRFAGRAPQLLLAGNAAHADIPLHAPGSGLMGVLLVMLGQTVGFPVPEGGSGRLAEALVRRFRSLGGTVRCSAEVSRIDVTDRRATGVRTSEGEVFTVAKAVIADVSAPHLYGGLVAASDLPARTLRRMRSFELDPGTVKVDWAMKAAVPWKVPPPHAPGTVHVADSVEQMNDALTQVTSGAIPAAPFMLVGQMTTADPTRSPSNTESLWAYTHVPQVANEDAGGEGIRGRWDYDDCERFADRMQARLERLAPGFGDRVLSRRVLGPVELESRNANLVGGAINGGTSQLHQQLILRPIPGWGRAETPIKGLYLGSASAHPGGGVHGAPGMNAARAALAHARLSVRAR